MKIGFTGTRHGMSEAQTVALVGLLGALQPTEVHHGDCVGADAEFHHIVRKRFPDTKIVIHPPLDAEHQAHCVGDATRPLRTHFARNRAIVLECDYLVATPLDNSNPGYGGTWYTIGFARKRGVLNIVIQRDGTSKE